MNKAILMGRLTADPNVSTYNKKDGSTGAVAKYTLACDRIKSDTADFINCKAFDAKADFAEKYLHKGTKIVVEGSIQTGSYTDKDGVKRYTTDILVSSQEFCESKGSGAATVAPEQQAPATDADGFMDIPDNIGEELPFN